MKMQMQGLGIGGTIHGNTNHDHCFINLIMLLLQRRSGLANSYKIRPYYYYIGQVILVAGAMVVGTA